jgi:hypothetical protein
MSKVQIQGIYAAAVPEDRPSDLPKRHAAYGKAWGMGLDLSTLPPNTLNPYVKIVVKRRL